MQPIGDPETVRLIHETMVNEEMVRNGTRARRETDRPRPRRGDGIRTVIGKTLIALGTWIAPAHERLKRPAPAPR